MIQSFLRYYGGKKRQAPKFLKYIPKNNIEYVISPFVGGASFECFLLNHLPPNVQMVGFDIDPLIINYHNCFIENPKKLYQTAKKYVDKPMSKNEFLKYGKQLTNDKRITDFTRAALLLALSLNGYNGKIFTYAKKPNITNITKMKDMAPLNGRFRVINRDGFDALEDKNLTKRKDIFWYIDPPYWIESNYYGIKKKQNDFDHERLAKALAKIKGKWMLSYNNCSRVKKAFKNFKFHVIPVYYNVYSQSKYKQSVAKANKEILITNY